MLSRSFIAIPINHVPLSVPRWLATENSTRSLRSLSVRREYNPRRNSTDAASRRLPSQKMAWSRAPLRPPSRWAMSRRICDARSLRVLESEKIAFSWIAGSFELAAISASRSITRGSRTLLSQKTASSRTSGDGSSRATLMRMSTTSAARFCEMRKTAFFRRPFEHSSRRARTLSRIGTADSEFMFINALIAMMRSSFSSFADGHDWLVLCDDGAPLVVVVDDELDVEVAVLTTSRVQASSPRRASSPQMRTRNVPASPRLAADDGYRRFRSSSEASADERLLEPPARYSEYAR